MRHRGRRSGEDGRRLGGKSVIDRRIVRDRVVVRGKRIRVRVSSVGDRRVVGSRSVRRARWLSGEHGGRLGRRRFQLDCLEGRRLCPTPRPPCPVAAATIAACAATEAMSARREACDGSERSLEHAFPRAGGTVTRCRASVLPARGPLPKGTRERCVWIRRRSSTLDRETPRNPALPREVRPRSRRNVAAGDPAAVRKVWRAPSKSSFGSA